MTHPKYKRLWPVLAGTALLVLAPTLASAQSADHARHDGRIAEQVLRNLFGETPEACVLRADALHC